ncbi:V-type ATP synthase subunit F [bacterium]|nr:V-type ATP synthase subunit F [bacterium]
MRYYIIGDKETVLGFSLIGIEGAEVETKPQIMKAIKKAIDRQDVGIILITERAAEQASDIIENLLCDKKRCHLILSIPDTKGPLKGRRSLEEFIHSALGIKV